MPDLSYNPSTIGMTVRQQIGETDDPSAHIDLLTTAIETLTAQVNANLKGVAFAIKTGSGVNQRQQNISAAYQIASTDGSIFANTTGAGLTATLPEATRYPGMVIMVQRDTGANVFTVAASATDVVSNTVVGGATLAVTTPVWLQSDGVSNWRVIG